MDWDVIQTLSKTRGFALQNSLFNYWTEVVVEPVLEYFWCQPHFFVQSPMAYCSSFFHLSFCGFGALYAIKSLSLKSDLALAHNNKVVWSLNDLKPGALKAISVV